MTETFDTPSRYFAYREGRLFVEEVDLQEIAEHYQTPTYVYSQAALLDALEGYRKGLEGIPHLIAYSVKANGNLALLRLLAEQGAGADLTSGGEMQLALRGGVPAERMVFSGVGKTDKEIRDALRAGVRMLNVESEPELETISAIAEDLGQPAPISIRVNPNIDAKTHPKITTGLKEHKFGVPWDQAVALYRRAAGLSWIQILGISAHIGSSLADTTPLLQTLDRLLELRDTLQKEGIPITTLDLGGGLGIRYDQESPDTPESYAAKIKERLRSAGVMLILEPGRSIVGNSAVLLCRVTYVKRSDDHTFVVVDAGMNDLARPAIYGAFHRIVPVSLAETETESVNVVGPICESSDVFGKQRVLPRCRRGDLLAICSAGAYGFSMASHYNGRVLPAEVLISRKIHRLVRKRETVEELWRHQIWE